MILTIILVIIFPLILHIYNINRRPKNFPPGPFSLPIIGGLYALGTQSHKNLTGLKEKYGKIIGIDMGSIRAVILNDQKMIKEAFDLPSFNDRPNFEIGKCYKGKNYSGLIWTGGSVYEEQRSFAVKTLRSLGVGKRNTESLILDHLQKLLNEFDKKEGQLIVNNKGLFNAFAVGALWTIVTGETSGEHDEEFKTCLDAVDQMLAAVSATSFAFFCPGICKLFPNISGWNKVIKNGLRQNEMAKRIIQFHEKSLGDGESSDFVDAYLEKIKSTTEKKSSFYGDTGYENLIGVITDLFLAGSETVAVALNWAILFLVVHPKMQNKMYNEIRETLGNILPSLADRNRLPYVEAFILETFRYSAMVPLAASHCMSKDEHFHGFVIPKGTAVIPNLYWVLHDPESWKDPESFQPERFLNENGTEVLRNHSANYVFGSGKRVCIGDSLAKDEIFLCLTALCQRFHFSIPPKCHEPKLEGNLGITYAPHSHSIIINRRQI